VSPEKVTLYSRYCEYSISDGYASVKVKLWRSQGTFLEEFDASSKIPIILENLRCVNSGNECRGRGRGNMV
jgi:hypothetical protein